MTRRTVIVAGCAVALAARLACAQAPVPTSYSGPWRGVDPPEGWTFFGLGVDPDPGYDGTNTAAKLDDAGDFISVHYAGAAGAVSYWIKGLTFISGGVFRVEQSGDGADWTALAVQTNLPAEAVYLTHFPSPSARHLRFLYAERVTGNVGIDGISVAAFVWPAIGSVGVAGGIATLVVPESVPGRTYGLEHADALTNQPVIWTSDYAAAGSAAPLVFTNAVPGNAPKRYFRVLDVTP